MNWAWQSQQVLALKRNEREHNSAQVLVLLIVVYSDEQNTVYCACIVQQYTFNKNNILVDQIFTVWVKQRMHYSNINHKEL